MDGRFNFAPAVAVPLSRADRRMRERMFAKAMVKEAGVTRREAIEQVRATTRDLEQDALFKSSLYQVMVRDRDGLHVTVKRLDREPIFERDDLVEIGRQFVPEGAIAVELYPAESRVMTPPTSTTSSACPPSSRASRATRASRCATWFARPRPRKTGATRATTGACGSCAKAHDGTGAT